MATSTERALNVKSAMDQAWLTRPAGGLKSERGSGNQRQTLVFDRQPSLILDRAGGVVGVDAWVRLFDHRGAEIRVDPHRRIINPPTVPRSGIVDNGDGSRTLTPNPREALIEAVFDSVVSMPNAKGWRTRGTVTTVFATAPGGAGTALGYDTDYETARTTGFGIGDNHFVGQDYDNPDFLCYESFLIFDTSVLPDTDDVSDVVLSLIGEADRSATDFTAVAAASTYDGGAVAVSDYVSGANLAALTTYATWHSSNYSTAYNAFTSAGEAFNSAINRTGNTPIILYSDRHSAGTQPAGFESVRFTDADEGGTTSDPKLDITHEGAGLALAGTLTTAGTVSRVPQKDFDGTLTTAGAISNAAAIVLMGVLVTAGVLALLRTFFISLAGTLTTSGTLEAVRTALLSVAGTLTTAGTTVKQVGKSAGGTLTSAGAVTKATSLARAGTLTLTGALSKALPGVSFASTLMLAGGVAKQAQKALAGATTSAGVLTRTAQKGLTSSLTTAGSIGKAISKGIAGVLTLAGTFVHDFTNFNLPPVNLAAEYAPTTSMEASYVQTAALSAEYKPTENLEAQT